MMIIVSYDVKTDGPKGRRRLRRVAKVCKNYGQRVQFSVFELVMDSALWASVKNKLEQEIDPRVDSLRFYFLGNNYDAKVEHVGAKETVDQEGTLIV